MPAAHDAPPSAVERWGAIVWPSFFAAGVATMVFFALFDPVELGRLTWVVGDIDRKTGYTVGFFLFWACTFSSSLFTSILLRRNQTPGSPPRPGRD